MKDAIAMSGVERICSVDRHPDNRPGIKARTATGRVRQRKERIAKLVRRIVEASMSVTAIHPARALAPPRAAAVAGVIFSVLMGTSLVIVRLAVPAYQVDAGAWLNDPARRAAVRVAIHLAPFSGVAFLWFIGVLRNRVGALEDQFFATVFFGSGLLFVASLFASAAFSGTLVEAAASGHLRLLNSDTYYLVRQLGSSFLNVFAIKMAGVFIFSTSTIALRTSILPRWVSILGYACAVALLLVMTNWPWIALVFPIWMLILSAHILLAEYHRT